MKRLERRDNLSAVRPKIREARDFRVRSSGKFATPSRFIRASDSAHFR
jgi:hypothetical protein